MSEEELAASAARLRATRKEHLRKGGYPAKFPLGYRSMRIDGEYRIILDEKTALFIVELFQRVAYSKQSLTSIFENLTEQGLCSKWKKAICRKGFCNMLRNPFYCGRAPFDGELFIGKHEPLVSAEVFNAAQRRLKEYGIQARGEVESGDEAITKE